MIRAATIPAAMPDIRQAVLKELKVRGWSRGALVRALHGKRDKGKDVPRATVYQFLEGRTTINSDDLGLIFDVFGWGLPPSQGSKNGKRG